MLILYCWADVLNSLMVHKWQVKVSVCETVRCCTNDSYSLIDSGSDQNIISVTRVRVHSVSE
ncbi:Uncharacterized protein DAT39_001833 [Clarias magur]|uniref:Uncharacterized protein n=1 Tax=Clarias magur TaxID=1594786 RepID=A0A8J4V297_CLAMG|nr:Uncharacterized protein DAT39_001833 [Clarias magur]